MKEIKNKIEELERRINQLESQVKIRAKPIKTDKGTFIVLEQTFRSWHSPKYLKKVLEEINEKVE